jgi:hypothetical protein
MIIAGRLRLALIEDWKRAHKLLSVQLAALLLVLDTAYDYLPAVQQYLPDGWVRWIAVAIIAGRVIRQASIGKSGL